MISIKLPVQAISYPIILKSGSFENIVSELPKEKRIVVITDHTLQKLFGKALQNAAKELDLTFLSFPPGENSKNIQVVEDLANQMLDHDFGRQDTVLMALGGGIVGDIAGFLANIYMRGIPYIQIPTTLLAMVDSSIGGKTGVNSTYGKNLLGTIYQPQKVIISSVFLEKLPIIEIQNGLAEMVKHSILDGKNHFDELENQIPKILNRNISITLPLIEKSIAVKARHVEADEREENGIRAYLNFGHTIGHAIEKASNFEISHGHAISIGMMIESVIAEKELGFQGTEEIKRVLKKCGLPTELPASISSADLLKFMKHDKKNVGNTIAFSLPENFGKMKLCFLEDLAI
ncbi:3-dehydroquinate synthase [Candidatus Peregrinibacteria bacterium]|nr:3-dehydroquinate synthase [Candidatus Peregrinibacteria bacterium]